MQDNDRKETDDIEIILEAAADADSTDADRGEFVFEVHEPEVALVFETETPEMLVFEEGEAEPLPEPKLTFTETEPEPPSPVLSVPEHFIPVADPPSADSEGDIPRVYTAYVPRFTSASENYRMASSSKVSAVRGTPEAASADSEASEVDPIAEIDADCDVGDAVSVNVRTAPVEEERIASTVFKFSHPEVATDTAPTEEEAVHISAEPAPPSAAEAVTEEPEVITEPEPVSPEEGFAFPDPVSDASLTPTYTVSSWMTPRGTLAEPSEGIGDPEINKRGEYRSYSARDSFKDRFLDGIMSIRIRFFVALIFSLVLLVAENLWMLGVDIPRLIGISELRGAMAVIDAQFILCLFLLAMPEVVISFKQLLHGLFYPELLLTLEFFATAAYTAVAVYSAPTGKYPLFGLVFAVSVLAAIGGSYYKKTADFTAFKTVSQSGEKIVADKKYTRTLIRENAALDGRVEEHRSKTARFFKTVFVSDFFALSERTNENKFNFFITAGASLGAALVTGVISYFVHGGIFAAAASFALVLMLACPALSIMVHKIPFHFASREAESESSAVIGEQALFDYSGVDVIVFNDDEVFGNEDVTLRDVKNFDNTANPTKALRQMSALFMNVGGPLDVLFSDVLDRKTFPAQNTLIELDGIMGEIDGHTVLAGPKSYMLRKGITIPENDVRFPTPSSESVRMMYIAEDGAAYAKLYIRYSFSEEFSMLLPTLYDSGITPLVYSRDPNIDGALVKYLTAGVDKIRVIKRTDSPLDEAVTYSKITAGLVTLKDKENAVNMLLMAKRYVHLQSRLAVTELIAMAVGGTLAAVLSIGAMTAVPTLIFAAWQAAWCGVLHFVSAKSFNSKNAAELRKDGE